MSLTKTEMTQLLWTAKDRGRFLSNLLQFENDLKNKEVITECKIAILSGSTTALVSRLLKLFLLNNGIKVEVFEGHFGNFFIDAINPSAELLAFKPDIVYIHTSRVNLKSFGNLRGFVTGEDGNTFVDDEISQSLKIWKSLSGRLDCWIIQNNFDFPVDLALGNSEATEAFGHNLVTNEINHRLVFESKSYGQVLIHDINSLSASIGLDDWWSSRDWIQYGLAVSTTAHPRLSFSLASVITSILGESKKCLILDFDNTLWGGVIGEVGVNLIELGPDTARGKAFLEFQLTIKDLASRGVLIAGCTKNEMKNALAGLNHPNSILKPEDFAIIEASWDPKPVAMQRIIQLLNIGARFFVFVDDSKVEVHSVKAEFPEIETVLLDSKFPEKYSSCVLRPRYFESAKLTREDVSRKGSQITVNVKRATHANSYDHIRILRDLNAVATIGKPRSDQLERVLQLVNKTNQFNLNGIRRTPSEIKRFAEDADSLLLVGEFKDDLTNYGLTSVIGGRFVAQTLKVEVWVMSCRTFDRYFEHAMLVALCDEIAKNANGDFSLDFKRTARNDYFVTAGAGLGLFAQPIADGICEVEGKKLVLPIEMPLKVVLR
jgi:FkbH-like protein